MNAYSPKFSRWPHKVDLFDVQVSATTYQECEDAVMQAATLHQGACVAHLPVHGIVEAATRADYRSRINEFDIVAPDGQPVRWALNKFHGAQLPDRVYGPELFTRLCRRAEADGVSIYLFGSTPEVVDLLRSKLSLLFPQLVIAGYESPPFRPLSDAENDAVCSRINTSGAGIVFVGLGCPRQEVFAHRNRSKINAVQLCVGAAFDFHAGNKKMAPLWMQKRGLEWLFRLTQEPNRLWKRYLVTNSIFMGLVGKLALRRFLDYRHRSIERAIDAPISSAMPSMSRH